MSSPSTRAEVGITLSRLAREGAILGFRTNFDDEIKVTVFVGPDIDHELVGVAVRRSLEAIPEEVVVIVKAGSRRAELPPRGPSPEQRARLSRQRAVTLFGCVVAVLLAVAVAGYLPGL